MDQTAYQEVSAGKEPCAQDTHQQGQQDLGRANGQADKRGQGDVAKAKGNLPDRLAAQPPDGPAQERAGRIQCHSGDQADRSAQQGPSG